MRVADHAILALAAMAGPAAAVPARVYRSAPLYPRDNMSWPCGPDVVGWPLNDLDWRSAKVDQNLKVFRTGGNDTEGLMWPPFSKTMGCQFASAMGIEMLNTQAWNCSIETPCDVDILDCTRIGQYGGNSAAFKRSKWGYFALNAMVNLNQRFTNVYQSLQAAEADLANMNLDLGNRFGKHSTNNLRLREALVGLSTIFGIVAGFAPLLVAPELGAVLGPVLGGVGASLGAVGGFMGLEMSKNDPNANVEQFGHFTANFSAFVRRQLDFAAGGLFRGERVANYTIEDVLAGGAWVQRDLTPLSNTADNLRVEVLARAINALWKQSKIWVSYVNLNDDAAGTKCKKDRSGPQATKYCGDGGVYYLYRYNEMGSHRGKLTTAWGQDDLHAVGIQPSWVSESSAKSYRMAPNGFDYDQVAGAQQILEIATREGVAQFNNKAGRLPGTWTIPVCDMSTYTDWNLDYVNNDVSPEDYESPMPCFCGPNGTRTAAFVKDAQMENFDTYKQSCRQQLRNVNWPPGVDKVEYGWFIINR